MAERESQRSAVSAAEGLHGVSPDDDVTSRSHLRPMTATPFGKYVLIGTLGKGGMGEVNLAVASGRKGFAKLVVVKRLLAHLNAEESYVAMFLDEARLAARLNHPHCVQTYEVDDVEGSHYLAMEYLEGLPLDRLLVPHMGIVPAALPVPICARIAADALDGLAYAHELTDFDGSPLSIVHRDISPQNLFVTYTGMVKILDFGIAKAATQVERTRTGVIKGKFAYISPEQAKGEAIDQRADIWSMGVVLWESLTRRRLFKRNNEAMTLQETLMGTVPAPSSVRADVPPEIDAIVLKALARDRDQRWADAHQMKDALEHYLTSLPEPPTRKTLAALMRERFADALSEQKTIVRRCLEASNVNLDASISQVVAVASMTPSEIQPLGADASGPAWPVPGGREPSQRVATQSGTGGYAAIPPAAVSGAFSSSSGMSAELADPAERRRRGALILLIAVLLLVIVFLGTRLLLGGDETAPVAGAPSTTLPTERAAGEHAEGHAAGAPGECQAETEVAPAPVDPTSMEPAPVEASPEAASPEPEVAVPSPSTEPSPRARGGSRASRRRERAASAPTSEAPSPSPAAEFGFLSIDTVPWSEVTIDGRRLGTTPLVRVRLPAGTHTLVLRNPEQDLTERYTVEIPAGETVVRRLGLR